MTRTARLILCAGALVLGGCASTAAPPGTQVSEQAFAGAVLPGQTAKADLLRSFGPTRAVVFASGYEAWLYQTPAGPDRYTELVVLIGPDGIVKKTRRRAP